jgi:hypothetical protein
MTFQEQIQQGIPSVLPKPNPDRYQSRTKAQRNPFGRKKLALRSLYGILNNITLN